MGWENSADHVLEELDRFASTFSRSGGARPFVNVSDRMREYVATQVARNNQNVLDVVAGEARAEEIRQNPQYAVHIDPASYVYPGGGWWNTLLQNTTIDDKINPHAILDDHDEAAIAHFGDFTRQLGRKFGPDYARPDRALGVYLLAYTGHDQTTFALEEFGVTDPNVVSFLAEWVVSHGEDMNEEARELGHLLRHMHWTGPETFVSRKEHDARARIGAPAQEVNPVPEMVAVSIAPKPRATPQDHLRDAFKQTQLTRAFMKEERKQLLQLAMHQNGGENWRDMLRHVTHVPVATNAGIERYIETKVRPGLSAGEWEGLTSILDACAHRLLAGRPQHYLRFRESMEAALPPATVAHMSEADWVRRYMTLLQPNGLDLWKQMYGRMTDRTRRCAYQFRERHPEIPAQDFALVTENLVNMVNYV